ncbi:MAG: hypothetical protein GX592_14790, partial [Clostridiales bacterium]|nr:hypothetical protein [Clostridiales bacterium]
APVGLFMLLGDGLGEPPASVSAALSVGANTANAGDTLSWTVAPSGGEAPYEIRFSLFKDYPNGAERVYPAQTLASDGEAVIFTHTAEDAASYGCRVEVSCISGTFTSDDDPSARIEVNGPSVTPVTLSIARSAERILIGGELSWTITPAGGCAPYSIEAAALKKKPDGSWESVAERDFDTAGEPVTLTVDPAEMGEYRCRATILDDDGVFNTPVDSADTHIAVVPPVASIAPAFASIALGIGEQCDLTVSALPEGSVPGLSYQSNKTSVASVDGAGTVTAKKAGTATITISDAGGASTTVSVVVKKEPTSVSLSAGRSTLGVNEAMPLDAALSNGSAGHCTFESSNPDVAVIEGSSVKAVTPGTAHLTVTTYNGKSNAKKPFKLTVLPEPEDISLGRTELTLGVRDSRTLKAALTPEALGRMRFPLTTRPSRRSTQRPARSPPSPSARRSSPSRHITTRPPPVPLPSCPRRQSSHSPRPTAARRSGCTRRCS